MIPLLPAGIGVPAPLLKAVTGHVFNELSPRPARRKQSAVPRISGLHFEKAALVSPLLLSLVTCSCWRIAIT